MHVPICLLVVLLTWQARASFIPYYGSNSYVDQSLVDSVRETCSSLVPGQRALRAGVVDVKGTEGALLSKKRYLLNGQDEIDSALSNVLSNQVQLQAWVAGLEKGQARLRNGQANLATGQDWLLKGQKNLENGVGILQDGQDTLRAGQESILGEVSDLESGQERIQEWLDNVQRLQAKTQEEVDGVQAELDGVREVQDGLVADVDALQADAEVKDRTLAVVRGNQAAILDTQAVIQRRDQEIDALVQALQALQAQNTADISAAGVQARDAVLAALNALLADIAAVREDTEAALANQADLRKDIAHLPLNKLPENKVEILQELYELVRILEAAMVPIKGCLSQSYSTFGQCKISELSLNIPRGY